MTEKIVEDFKINVFFNEDNEELEKLIANFLSSLLKENKVMVWIRNIKLDLAFKELLRI